MKTCSKCGVTKPITEYHYKRGQTQNRCRTCRSEYQKQHYIKNRERERGVRKAWYEANKSKVCQQLKEQYRENPEKFMLARKLRKYGLSRESYYEMLASQKNSCAICETKFVSTPSVDHCHSTQKVRGLLCSQCNTGLGLLKEDPAIFKSAVAYLRKYKK